MRNVVRKTGLLALLSLLLVAPQVTAQTLQPPFDVDYSVHDLGQPPGIPARLGGVNFALGDLNTLIIGGSANTASGKLYAIGVTRDADNHITGFVGSAVVYADAAYNDGGISYGPDDVLFLARWPINELGQTKAGSIITDKIIQMGPFGVAGSLAAVNFVPAGFPGAGSMKAVSWGGGQWYTFEISPDGAGTFDLDSATFETQIAGGPEGFVYVPPGSPEFDDFDSLLVSEFSANKVTVYNLDAGGNPIPATRTDFLTGLGGAEGALIDPLSGDFIFSTFGGGDRVVTVRGFEPPCDDGDGDGFGDPGDASCPGGADDDCDDDDDVVNPGAREDCGNGIDDDCDGLVDGADADDCQAPCNDGDDDGYGSPGDASCPAGGLEDCADNNSAVNPGANEDCDNGIDDDCDGAIDDDDSGDCQALLVQLESFSAHTERRGVRLQWRTTSEIDNFGFRIVRARMPMAKGLERVQDPPVDLMQIVTLQTILAQGTPLTGASYEYFDRTKLGTDALHYYLEDIDNFGRVTRHGPVVLSPERQAGPSHRGK